MKQDSKKEKKSTKHYKPNQKISWLDKVKLWLLQRSKIAFLLDSSVFWFSAIGLLYLLLGTTFVPKPYQNLNYVFPLYMNLVFLVNMLYHGVFRDTFDGMLTVHDFVEPFLYLNGVGLLFHSFFGIMGRNRKTIPPLLTLDSRYIWFPILTYITFFLVATLIILISKHNEKKKREENNGKNTFKKSNSNTKKNRPRKESFRLWLDSHKFLGFFLVLGLILAMGLGLNLIFKNLPIPSPYRDINYSFPIYINLFCLVYRLFDYWFLDLTRTRMTIKRYADLFIYLNSIGLIVHLFLGVGGKNSKGILPSLLSLDHRYIWFPIATYLVFFTIPALIVLFMKYIEKKRSQS